MVFWVASRRVPGVRGLAYGVVSTWREHGEAYGLQGLRRDMVGFLRSVFTPKPLIR